jgi:hypothetical protein
MPTPDAMSEEPRPFILPQFGIFAQGTHAHFFLEFDLKPDTNAAEAVGRDTSSQ